MRDGLVPSAPTVDRGGPPIRIDVVTETWPPEVNGVAMTLGRLVDAMRRRGHEVGVVRPRQASDPARSAAPSAGGDAVRSGLPVPGYRELRWGLPAGGWFRRRWRCRRPAVVHVATEGPLGLSAVRAARALRIPVTSSFHTNFDAYGAHYGYGWLAKPVRRYLRWFHNLTHLTLVPSADLRAELEADGFDRCRILGRGVDSGRFRPDRRDPALRAAWGLGARDIALLVVGRVAPEKNLALALRTLDTVRRRRPDARLVLAGDGPSRAEFAGRPGVLARGRVLPEELPAHFASADLFLFPSLTETFGNVLCEAMASGLASVSFDYAAAGMHVTHGRDGLKVSRGDAAGFVREAVRASEDAELRAALGASARRRALELDWGRVVDQFEQEVRGAASSPRRCP